MDTLPGKYYSGSAHLAIGVGQFFDNVRYPVVNVERQVFQTAEGLCYLLTHECDLDPSNSRSFNDFALILPVIRFDIWYAKFATEFSEEPARIKSFLKNLAHRAVSRVMYIPCIGADLEFGGLLYLNQLTSTHVSLLQSSSARLVCSLTGYGLDKVDHMLQRHLLRPKANRLAFTPTS